MKYAFKIGATAYEVEVGEMTSGQVPVTVNGKRFEVVVDQQKRFKVETGPAASAPVVHPTAQAQVQMPPAAAPSTVSTEGAVVAPIPGLIVEVKVMPGDRVTAGQWVATMEAMKMENQLTTHLSGIVQEIAVQKGSEVSTGQLVMRIGID